MIRDKWTKSKHFTAAFYRSVFFYLGVFQANRKQAMFKAGTLQACGMPQRSQPSKSWICISVTYVVLMMPLKHHSVYWLLSLEGQKVASLKFWELAIISARTVPTFDLQGCESVGNKHLRAVISHLAKRWWSVHVTWYLYGKHTNFHTQTQKQAVHVYLKRESVCPLCKCHVSMYLRSSGLSFSVKKVMAFPWCPALPVRPVANRKRQQMSRWGEKKGNVWT